MYSPNLFTLFQCIPLYLPKSFFKSIDKVFTSFIWEGKKPRIRLLQRPIMQGGLALPDLCHYYWASNVQKIMPWLHTPDTDWCHFEAASCTSTSFRALVTSNLPISTSRYTTNPVVINTLKIWFQLRHNFGFNNFLHISPIHNNHIFLPARLDSEFTLWERQRIHKFKDMYINSIFASFDELLHKFGLPRSSLFCYLQVCHFLQHHDPNFPYLPSPSGLDDLLETTFSFKGIISRINNCVSSFGTALY